LIALFFAITGDMILDIFSIHVDSLRIAGGILLFTIAFDMIQARVSRESITEKEIDASQKREDIWIFPIALPLLSGPATIATIILLMKNATFIGQQIMVILAILATFIVALIAFMYSWRIYKVMGYTGMLVISRLLGLFLAALAVDMIINGIWNVYQTL
jgi:multiple antibiotic resistance protein